MGYMHSWTRHEEEIAHEVFQAMVADFRRLIPLLAEHGAILADPWGKGKPTLTDDVVSFNGLANCGCRRKTGYDWMKLLSSWDGDFQSLHDLDWAELRCSCRYDTFHFPRVDGEEAPNWCKTNRRRYDLGVTAFLVIAKHYLGDSIAIRSDSRERWWDVPRGFCQQVLGYGAGLQVARLWEDEVSVA